MIFRPLALTVLAAIFAPMALLAGLLGMWIGDRTPPGRLVSAKVVTPNVEPGGTFQIRFEVDRERSCETQVDRMLVDADGHREPLPDINNAQPLGPKAYIATAEVPYYFVRGRARYITATTYVCNPLHRWFPISAGVREFEFDVTP